MEKDANENMKEDANKKMIILIFGIKKSGYELQFYLWMNMDKLFKLSMPQLQNADENPC